MYKVILIDDEPWALRGLISCYDWESNNYKIAFSTTDPFEGLENILNMKPDVVFTDVKMHGLSGIDIIKKAKKTNSDSKFIVVSGYDDFNYAKECIELGIFYYILKPINKAEFYTVMEKLSHTLQTKSASTGHIPISIDGSDESNDKFFEIIKYINCNFTEDITLEHLSNVFYFHKTYLCNMFKTRLSMTFSQYITELKMKKAYSLLATTDLSISRIASLCGYDDSGYFTKVFKKNYDVTPKDFRIKQLFR